MVRKIRWRWYLLPLLALAAAQSAAACIAFPLPPRLPGERDDAFKQRAMTINAAQLDEERRAWQQNSYDRAERVFFARVSSVMAPTNDVPGRMIFVKPLHALKGDLPQTTVSMDDTRLSSCQVIVGGVRQSAKAGDYTIVFEKTRLNQGDPPITREIPIHEARDPRLLRAMFDWNE